MRSDNDCFSADFHSLMDPHFGNWSAESPTPQSSEFRKQLRRARFVHSKAAGWKTPEQKTDFSPVCAIEHDAATPAT